MKRGVVMTKFIVLLTFIPWFLYFASLCKSAIKDLNQKIDKTWIKENIFNIFHFENLILIGIFIYFSISTDKDNQFLHFLSFVLHIFKRFRNFAAL